MSASRRILVALIALAAAGAGLGGTVAAFSAQTDNTGKAAAAAPDLVAPTASTAVVVRTDAAGTPQGSIPGFLRSAENGTYRIYATVTDTGAPAAGMSPTDPAAVTGNSSTWDTGQTVGALADGSFVYGGITYGRRSAMLTPNTLTNAQALPFSLALSDLATPANSQVQSGFSATADTTAPAPSTSTVVGSHNVETSNAGTAGRLDAGDTFFLRYNDVIDPISILPGWDGSATDLTVRVLEGVRDSVEVWPASNTGAALPLGLVELRNAAFVTVEATCGGPGARSDRGSASPAARSRSCSARSWGAGRWAPPRPRRCAGRRPRPSMTARATLPRPCG